MKLFSDDELIHGRIYSIFSDNRYKFIGKEDNKLLFLRSNYYGLFDTYISAFSYSTNGRKVWYLNEKFKYGRGR